MFLENFRTFIKFYGKGKKTKLIGFAGLSFIAGILEFIGVALIYPFMLLIQNPQSIYNTRFYQYLTPFLNHTTETIMALTVGAIVLGIFIFKNIFMICILNLQNKFTTYWKRDIAAKFMEFCLYAPFKTLLKTSETDRIFWINTLAVQVIDNFILRVINLIINIIILSMIIGFLIWKFPIAAIVTISFIVTSMTIQNKFFKKRTTELSQQMVKLQQDYNAILVQNIYSLKDLKILSAEKLFFEKYLHAENNLRKMQIDMLFYSTTPPYIVETFIVMALMILGALISINNLNDNSAMIASFAVVVAALFRTAPALNRIQTSIININANRNLVIHLNNIYKDLDIANFKTYKTNTNEKLEFKHNIKLSNIDFSYDKVPVLKNINLEIQKGDFIGIIGLSGSGKTTLADVIMGLLPIDSGKISVDDTMLTPQNYPQFRKIIGYVTQDINVIEGTFRENVAWGTPEDEINDEKVCHALKQAQLYDIVMQYENGIYSIPIIGSNGLSQGQKQRLAMARALYTNPDILILDEATSSLDVVVENEITEVLNSMSQNKTIIAIAHRLSTLKSCNKLIYLKEGSIVDIGTFKELSEKYEDFKTLIKLSAISEKN